MRNVKKLTRGLKDISPYFFSSVGRPIENKEKEADFLPTPILRSDSLSQDVLPEVYCLTILPSAEHSQLLSSKVFVDEITTIFSEVYSLSFSVSHATPALASPVRQLMMPPFQISDVLHPEPILFGDSAPVFDLNKRVGFFLEPKSMFESHADLFQLLDHVILKVSTQSSDSILAAYQMLSACLQKNAALHFSLLIEGFTTDEMSEMVYERFAKITSQFWGCAIDFLGWIDQDHIQINRDLFFDMGNNGRFFRKPMKMQLLNLLSQELLLEAV